MRTGSIIVEKKKPAVDRTRQEGKDLHEKKFSRERWGVREIREIWSFGISRDFGTSCIVT